MRTRRVRRWARAAVLATIPPLAGIAGACGARAGAREEFAALERFQGREIERVVFVEPGPFSEDTLIQVTETQPSRCNLLGLPI